MATVTFHALDTLSIVLLALAVLIFLSLLLAPVWMDRRWRKGREGRGGMIR